MNGNNGAFALGWALIVCVKWMVKAILVLAIIGLFAHAFGVLPEYERCPYGDTSPTSGCDWGPSGDRPIIEGIPEPEDPWERGLDQRTRTLIEQQETCRKFPELGC